LYLKTHRTDYPDDRDTKTMFIDVLIGIPELEDGSATPETIAPSFRHMLDRPVCETGAGNEAAAIATKYARFGIGIEGRRGGKDASQALSRVWAPLREMLPPMDVAQLWRIVGNGALPLWPPSSLRSVNHGRCRIAASGAPIR
jgi:hypothetical protein